MDVTNPGGRSNPATCDGSASTGRFLISDSDAASGSNPTGSGMSHDLWSPRLDCALDRVWLHMDTSAQLNNNGEALFDVDVSTNDGASWVNVFRRVAPDRTDVAPIVSVDNADGFFGRLDIDLSAEAARRADVRFRLRHFEPNDDWWIAVDNVLVDDVPPPRGGSVTLLSSEDFAGGIPPSWEVRGLNSGNDTWNTNDPCGSWCPGRISGRSASGDVRGKSENGSRGDGAEGESAFPGPNRASRTGGLASGQRRDGVSTARDPRGLLRQGAG